MASFSLTFTIDEKDKRKIMRLNRNFGPKFRQHLSRTLLGFGTHARDRVKKEIRSGNFAAQGPAQVFIKGNGDVLRMWGNLEEGIQFKYVRSDKTLGIEVYVENDYASGHTGITLPRLATMLHEGATWKPTDAQRQALARRIAEGGGPPPSGTRKAQYTIPPRPFMKRALENPEVGHKFIHSVLRALDKTLNELGAKG